MNVIDMSGLNILVADSNHYMRKIIRAMLHGFGITNIREAADGALALETLKAHLIDLMIADYALETLNGVELTELVRGADDSHNQFIPIIMLSAYTEKWRIEGARDAGVTEFLRKPLCAQDLYLRLQEVIIHPRSFVRTARYFGPDRRRRVNISASTPARRAGDALIDRSKLLEAEPTKSSGPEFGKRPPIITDKTADELAAELFG